MSGERMRAEMAEQPDALRRLADRFDEDAATVRAVLPDPFAGVVFLARGSSDNAAVYGRYLAELASGRPAGLAAPSLHTLYDAPARYDGFLVVAISQSGETPEIVTVCRRLGEAGARTVAVRERRATARSAGAADAVLALGVGPERAVPATKTVTGQMLDDGRRGRGHRAGALRRRRARRLCRTRCAPCSTTPSPANALVGALGRPRHACSWRPAGSSTRRHSRPRSRSRRRPASWRRASRPPTSATGR